jgi:hypothetical protein
MFKRKLLPSGEPQRRRRLTALAGGALALACAMPAGATLGLAESSIEVDRSQMHAVAIREAKTSYVVHTLTIGEDVVREYVAPGGAVFGVAWTGPSLPNLRQLLGADQFKTYTTSPHRQRGGRGHLIVQEGNLVVESNGRARAFHGRAYLTNALPAGVTTDDVQ